ncbi:MAG: hypothetical protein J7642_14385 [Cyanobacteria bacterium SBC]|nr:hypothetical protein [Cyanobacteria bacterium SBC]
MFQNKHQIDRSQTPFKATNRPDERLLEQTQEIIYNYLLEIVRAWPPEDVLSEFRSLFIDYESAKNLEVFKSLEDIVLTNQENHFRSTVKRSCYILFNNWEANRQYKFIPQLIHLFQDSSIHQRTLSPGLQRVRAWLRLFVEGREYQDLKVFSTKYEVEADSSKPAKWSDRYTAYLLVPQYSNPDNPVEQREVARVVSQRLKDRFKRDLAMYITRSQMVGYDDKQYPNPSIFGEEVLRIVKTIVARRGNFSYQHLANVFLRQTENQNYRHFKRSLQKYLVFSWTDKELAQTLKLRLSERLDSLYPDKHHERVDEALRLRTCNRAIDTLTAENAFEPSPVFIWMLSFGNPLALVVILLKLVLASPHSRVHLETRIAQLIRYYEHLAEDECEWVVHFFELFKIIFAIHAENVEYSLVKVASKSDDCEDRSEDYRVFARIKYDELTPGFSEDDNTDEELADLFQ